MLALGPVNRKVAGVSALGAAGLTATVVAPEHFSLPTGLIEAGPWGLLVGVVAFMFFSLFKGWVVVKLHYDTLLARAEAAEAANVKLSERAQLLTETNATLGQTIQQNTAVGDTVTRVMNAIQEARITSGGTP